MKRGGRLPELLCYSESPRWKKLKKKIPRKKGRAWGEATTDLLPETFPLKRENVSCRLGGKIQAKVKNRVAKRWQGCEVPTQTCNGSKMEVEEQGGP